MHIVRAVLAMSHQQPRAVLRHGEYSAGLTQLLSSRPAPSGAVCPYAPIECDVGPPRRAAALLPVVTQVRRINAPPTSPHQKPFKYKGKI
jgi:hypothetical protein